MHGEQAGWLGLALVTGFTGFGAACAERTISELPPAQYPVEDKDIRLEINRDVDILFVIDDSISMGDEQASLGANFDRFIGVLDNLDGGLPNLHLGVATSNMGTLGVLGGACAGLGDNGRLHVGAAPIIGPERYLVDVEGPTPGSRVTNYGGDLLAAFAALASVGTLGCGFEQHLESMRAALAHPDNGGFLRPDASLAIVIVADEDDCSAYAPELFGNNPALGLLDSFRCFEYGVVCDQADLRATGGKTGCRPREPSPYLHDLARYADYVRAVKPVPEDLMVAAIVGDREPVVVGTQQVQGTTYPSLDPSCTYQPPGQPLQSADPAVRIGAFVDGFGPGGRQESICADDLSDPLVAIGQMIVDRIGDPCIAGVLVDTDPTTPELDAECSVALVSPVTAADPVVQILPACDATATVQPCWRLVVDLDRCDTTPTGLAIDIVRTIAPPPGTRIAASCVVE